MTSLSLRSSQQGLLLVPFAHTSAKQSCAFSMVGPRPETASLLNFVFFQEPCHLCLFLTNSYGIKQRYREKQREKHRERDRRSDTDRGTNRTCDRDRGRETPLFSHAGVGSASE